MVRYATLAGEAAEGIVAGGAVRVACLAFSQVVIAVLSRSAAGHAIRAA